MAKARVALAHKDQIATMLLLNKDLLHFLPVKHLSYHPCLALLMFHPTPSGNIFLSWE